MNNIGKTRIAPTPSGYLHRGNAYSFCLTYLAAKSLGLKLLLRIDDADQLRYRDAYAANIFDTLLALGIEWDEGPQSIDQLKTTWSTTHRQEQHQLLLFALRDAERLYGCSCSRKELQKLQTNDLPHPCLSEPLSLNQPKVAWRLKYPPATVKILNFSRNTSIESWPNAMNDVVLKQKNGTVAYQLGSLADDVYFEISHIIRGRDLWDSSLTQLGIGQILNSPFCQSKFYHHPLVVSTNGKKLAKSQEAPAILQRLQNLQKRALFFNELSHWLGFTARYDNLAQMASALSQNQEQLNFT
jgi:glutamyl-tRNA synthetase